jgi:hypothetical protein
MRDIRQLLYLCKVPFNTADKWAKTKCIMGDKKPVYMITKRPGFFSTWPPCNTSFENSSKSKSQRLPTNIRFLVKFRISKNSYFINNKAIFLKLRIFTNFNTVFPVVVLVFDCEEFSKGVLHGHCSLRHIRMWRRLGHCNVEHFVVFPDAVCTSGNPVPDLVHELLDLSSTLSSVVTSTALDVKVEIANCLGEIGAVDLSTVALTGRRKRGLFTVGLSRGLGRGQGRGGLGRRKVPMTLI